MKNFLSPLLAVTALVICVNLGVPSSEKREKPKENFYGTITTTGEITFSSQEGPSEEKARPVQNILIGGDFKRIKFYGKPSNKNASPMDETTFLDLEEIKSIRPTKPPSKDTVVNYHGRDYIEIVVTLKPKLSGIDPKQYAFLVESTRKIFCDFATLAGNLEQEISFEALKELNIQGFRHQEHVKSPEEEIQGPSAAKQALCQEARKNMKKLKKIAPAELLKPIEDLLNYYCKNL